MSKQVVFNAKLASVMMQGRDSWKNKQDQTVYRYYSIYNYDQFLSEIMKFGFVPLNSVAAPLLVDLFSLEYLCNVSWCEHDVCVVFYSSEEELKSSIEATKKFYEEEYDYISSEPMQF